MTIIAASRSKLLEDLGTLVFGCTIAIALWQPRWQWMLWLGIAALILAVGLRPFVDTGADKARRRRNLWLIPALCTALAVQLAWTAGYAGLLRILVLSCLLVAAGVGLFLQRRRVT